MNEKLKVMLSALITQDHIESLMRKGLTILGTWLMTNGVLTAGGEGQFIAGGATLATSFIWNYIVAWENKKSDNATVKLPIVANTQVASTATPASVIPEQVSTGATK